MLSVSQAAKINWTVTQWDYHFYAAQIKELGHIGEP